MIQSINSSQMQVWLYRSSRSCLSPTVGMLVFLTRFGPPPENEGKKLWIFAETYIGRTCSAHRPFEGVLRRDWGCPQAAGTHTAAPLCFNPVAKVHTWASSNSTERQLGSCVAVGLSQTSLGTCVPQVGEAQLQDVWPGHGGSCTARMLWITGVFPDFESNPGAGIATVQLDLDILAARLTWHLKMIPLHLSLAYGLGWGPPLSPETLPASAEEVVRLVPFQTRRVSASTVQLLSTGNLLLVEPASLKGCVT